MDDLISRQAAIDYLLDALYDLDEADYVDKEFIEEELKRSLNFGLCMKRFLKKRRHNATVKPYW